MPNQLKNSHRVIVLDFDGLICDGLDECILVSWNGYYDKGLSDFSSEGLQAIPKTFMSRFVHCRKFAKHLGHFAVSLFDSDTPIQTQEDFESVYRSLDPVLIQAFVNKVTQYRHLVRRNRELEWLKHHSLYPGMKQFLPKLDLPFYIVTAKDGDSVLKILSSANIYLTEDQVFGEQTQKLNVFSQLVEHEGIERKDLYFFDDNIMNVVDARRAGYSAYWATWGYNAPAHTRIAEVNAVVGVTLAEFLDDKLGVMHQ